MTELLRKHRRFHDQHAPPRIAGSARAASHNRGTLSIPRSVSQEQRLAIHGEATVWQHRDHGYVFLVSRASLRRVWPCPNAERGGNVPPLSRYSCDLLHLDAVPTKPAHDCGTDSRGSGTQVNSFGEANQARARFVVTFLHSSLSVSLPALLEVRGKGS